MPHLALELYQAAGQVKFLHVPYRGAAPALTDLLGGQIAALFADAPALLSQIQSGKLKAIGASYGYGYNLSLSAPDNEPPLKSGGILRPAQTALLADAAVASAYLLIALWLSPAMTGLVAGAGAGLLLLLSRGATAARFTGPSTQPSSD